MTPIKVHPMQVRNHEYEIRVDEKGRFLTNVGTETLYSSTRDGLRDKLMELTAKAAVKLAIPFVLVNGGGRSDPFARGTVVGVHGGNGNLLVEWSTGWQAGSKTQWSPSYGDIVFGDVTTEEVEQYLELRKLKNIAEENLVHYGHPRKLDIKVEAQAALQKAVDHGAA